MKRYITRDKIAYYVGIVFALLYIYQALFGIFEPQLHRGLFILFTLILGFLLKPVKKTTPLDVSLVILSLVSISYFIMRYEEYNLQVGMPINNMDVLFGTATIALTIEVCRRHVGWSLVALALFSIVYLSFGEYFPELIRHGGFSWNTVVSNMYAGLNGIFGSVTYTFAEYVFLLVVFGAFLKKGGATGFYIDLSKSLVGHTTGGPAKIAVISSGLLGSVTGSATANVAITGVVTIPMMIKAGYPPFKAGATEAAASYGGTILPPVMGAAAFIMCALVNVPYVTVIKYAAIPAVLYYLGVYFSVHFDACRMNLKVFPKGSFPSVKETVKAGGHLIVPPLFLVFLLFLGYSMGRISTGAIASVVVFSAIRKKSRMSIRDVLDALAEGAQQSISILAVLGAVQIITVGVFLPGTGLKISNMIVQLSGNSLFLATLIIFALSYVLGMGLPITPAYLVLATLAAPALLNLGAPLMGAHLLVLWWANSSAITPPVCLAVYVACALAKSSLWSTGMEAVKKASINFVLPFLFIYDPLLLLNGSPARIVFRIGLLILAILSFQAGMTGYFWKRNALHDTVLLILGATLLFIPYTFLNLIGLACVFLVFLFQRRLKAKNRAVLSAWRGSFA